LGYLGKVPGDKIRKVNAQYCHSTSENRDWNPLLAYQYHRRIRTFIPCFYRQQSIWRIGWTTQGISL